MNPFSVQRFRFTCIFKPARAVGMLALMSILTVTSGCDRIKSALNSETPAGAADPVWKADSTMLASSPGIVFRVLASKNGPVVAPIATIGAQGFRKIRLGPRGWRALDVQYLGEGNTLTAINEGRPAGTIRMIRGMWSAGTQLDSMPTVCPRITPAGLASLPSSSIQLATAGPTPKLNAVSSLSAGELQEAIATIPTLIAPSSGISTPMLARYRREVHVLNTGNGPRPSILVIYNDPEGVSDSLQRFAQRPRQFVVILDKGIYGYKTTYTFATVGNQNDMPRTQKVDYLDVDGDGKAELFMTFEFQKGVTGTQVLKFENDSWHEVLRTPVRCL